MPDLGSVVPEPSPSVQCPQLTLQSLEVFDGVCCKLDHRLRLPISSRAVTCSGTSEILKRERKGGKKLVKSLEDHVKAWVDRKVESGARPIECSLPFLTDSPKMVFFKFSP